MKLLKEELGKLPARKLLVFLNACHSARAREVSSMASFNPKSAGLA